MMANSMPAVAVIVAAGAALQASVGIGFGVLTAPLLVILAPELVPGPVLLVGAVLAGMTMTREFRSVKVRELSLAVLGRFAGSAAAGAVIALLPMTVFGTIFALMILAGVGLSLAKWRLLPTAPNLIAAGLLSGFMGTITSVGSPPIGLVYQHMPGPQVRATVGAFFMLGAGFSVVTLAAIGRFGRPEAIACAWLMPPMVLGFLLSKRFIGHVDKSRDGIRLAVLAVSAVAAVALLLKPLF